MGSFDLTRHERALGWALSSLSHSLQIAIDPIACMEVHGVQFSPHERVRITAATILARTGSKWQHIEEHFQMLCGATVTWPRDVANVIIGKFAGDMSGNAMRVLLTPEFLQCNSHHVRRWLVEDPMDMPRESKSNMARAYRDWAKDNDEWHPSDEVAAIIKTSILD